MPLDPTPVPVSGDIQVNTYRVDAQFLSSVTALADGGYVVTWSSWGQDGSSWGIYGRRFKANGAAGTEFPVNSTTSDGQLDSSAAALADGGFVVTWASNGQDGSLEGVFGRLYDATGTARGGEFKINTFTQNNQHYSPVAALADGGFVVTWSSVEQDGDGLGIYGRRFDANGIAIGGEFAVNTTTADNQYLSALAALSNGDFVVTWQSRLQDGDGWGIFGRRFDAKGPASSEFAVNTTTMANQGNPSVAALTEGGYVVSWEAFDQNGVGLGIFCRRFDASGAAMGGEFVVTTSNQPIHPCVTGLADGGYIVTWTSFNQDGDGWGIYGRRYDERGAAGAEFRLNEITAGDQFREVSVAGPTAAQLSDGRFVATWYNLNVANDSDVFLRVFDVPPVVSNRAPTIISNGGGATAALSVAENTTAVTVVAATDADAGQTLAYSIVGGADAAQFMINASTGALTFVVAPNFESPTDVGANSVYIVIVQASDGNGGTATQALAVTVADINEQIVGSAQADTIYGGPGADTLIGLAGDDKLYGGGGNDLIRPGTGANLVDGGAGVDTVDYSDAIGGVYVSLSSSPTNANGYAYQATTAGASFATVATAGAYTRDTLVNVENIIGSTFDDRLYGNSGDNTFRPGKGNDIVYGGGGSDTLDYSDAVGGVYVSLSSNPVAPTNSNGYAYEATTAGASYANAATAGAHTTDVVIGVSNAVGSAFDDRLYGTAGANMLEGGARSDILYGLAGDDTLIGGAGDDALIGGTGTNTFVFAAGWGHDTILAWADGTGNLLDFSALATAGVHQMSDLTISDGAGGVVISFGSDSVRIGGTTVAQLSVSNFKFG